MARYIFISYADQSKLAFTFPPVRVFYDTIPLQHVFFSFQATKAQYLISISIFSLAPALGTGIGTYLSESKNEDKKESEHDLVLQILQGKYSQVSL